MYIVLTAEIKSNQGFIKDVMWGGGIRFYVFLDMYSLIALLSFGFAVELYLAVVL